MSAKAQQCPVLGCGMYRNRWNQHGYPLPDVGVFTLQLDSGIDAQRNSCICRACWLREKDHGLPLCQDTRDAIPVLAAFVAAAC